MFAIKIILAITSLYVIEYEHTAEATCSCSANNVSGQEKDIIGTVHDLGRKLSYAFWNKDPSTNVILSPLSIAVILNLLLLATDGTTNQEIKQAINYKNELQEREIHEVYQSILSCLQVSENGVEISLLTRIFVQEGFIIFNSFLSTAEASYMSEVEKLDFSNNPKIATDRINNWVSESSKGKINNLFPEPLSTDTVTVLVNVIFFNATWENQFSSNSTTNGIFKAESGNISIPMMNQDMIIPYLRDENKGLEMISLPYEGNCYSMVILKPIDNSDVSLQEIENILNADELKSLITRMEEQKVKVTIPRMKIELEYSLIDDFKSFGINKIFVAGGNFSRFTSQTNIVVSEIKHKAILEVTEAGTVATAATAAVIGIRSVLFKFEMNSPSLLLIRNNHNGLILFWARVMKPEPLSD